MEKNEIKNQEKIVEINDEFCSIPINKIVIEDNVRKDYAPELITELADSIKSVGLLQAIKVYDRGNDYAIIFGHRRFLACRELGYTHIKVIIGKKPDALDRMYLQLVENLQKEDISAKDIEDHIHILKNNHKQSVEDIASRLGKSKNYVYKYLDAKEGRDKHGQIFDDAGIVMTTSDAARFKNVPIEDLREAVDAIKGKPNSKTDVLHDLQYANRKRKGKTKKNSLKFTKNNNGEERAYKFTITENSKHDETEFKKVKEIIIKAMEFLNYNNVNG